MGGGAVRVAGQPVAEEWVGSGSEVVEPGSCPEPVEMAFGVVRQGGPPAEAAWSRSRTLWVRQAGCIW